MKILYIATSFPEPNKGDTIYTDLAEALHEGGHDITVAVAEQSRNLDVTTMKKERGFDVLRIVTGNYYDVNLFEKGLTTLKIPFLMRSGIKKYLSNHTFDFILFEAPPVTNVSLVSWAKIKFNCPAYLMLKDIFPQNAVDLNMMRKNGILFKYFESQEKKLYRVADTIGCMSQANKKYILNHNPQIEPEKVTIFPNTKKIMSDINFDDISKGKLRDKYNIPKNACLFLFGGNMGVPQYIDILCEAVLHYKGDSNVFFLFVGRGTERYKLENIIEHHKISNALVLENLPRDDYNEITKEADIGLIVLDPRFTIPNYPSRILSYMEYGKPVLAVTDEVSDVKDLIDAAQCGEWVHSKNTSEFLNKIDDLSKREDLSQLGKNGRKYMERHLSVEQSVQILEKHFMDQERTNYV